MGWWGGERKDMNIFSTLNIILAQITGTSSCRADNMFLAEPIASWSDRGSWFRFRFLVWRSSNFPLPVSVPGQVVSVVLYRTYILEILKIRGQCNHIGRPQKSPLIYIQHLLNQEYSKNTRWRWLIIGQEFPDVNGEFRVYIPSVYTPYRLINLSHPL